MWEDLAADVAAAQADENLTHTDTFKITRTDPDDPGVYDPITGTTTKTEVTIIPALMGRMRSPSAGERQETAGEHQWSMSDVIWRIAAGTTGIQLKDTVTCTASPQGVNVGGKFTVMYALTGSHVTAARFIVRRVDV